MIDSIRHVLSIWRRGALIDSACAALNLGAWLDVINHVDLIDFMVAGKVLTR